jgi:excisionase family DNA binding protein
MRLNEILVREESLGGSVNDFHARLATRAEVADYLQLPVTTLAQWAYLGTGPRYRVVGKHARYRWSDVEAWLDEKQKVTR